ncbi:MAG: thiolase family protein [Pseudomonadota bacterium]|nr:thiolase family protein [Pseudomonadota bacterium]MEC7251130.1 thiolase family protein [Pseudomonadota bacterium]MEC7412931.1 thiolase family protein [Pseudomonadota bacterium]MEC7555390.1 thiolase family protein [Pseudomonadota bacterium]MEC7613077.1 thiolase family protein [Pseudomonadota bacterium]
MSSDVFIVGAARTPVGSLQGTLASQTAPQLGAHAIAAALSHADINASDVDEVVMGNVVSAGLKQAPARQAMRQAKLPDSCGATTINKVCGSGMKAAMIATDLIRAGSADTVVAGGMESMSNAPYLLDKARSGLRMGHTQMLDALFTDGLEDAETGGSMGSFAQNTADQHQLTREAMDAYAIESVTRARNAIENRSLASEIAPMEINGTLVEDDEQPGRAKIDRIPSLRPAFKADGTITAANASSISDGASALVLASADALGDREPLAKVVGHATHSIHPSEFTLAPIGAIQKLADKIGWDLDSVDLFEINEAFAMVTMLTVQELGLDTKRVNVFGGACAQGHPIGSTGSRLIVTLAHAMKNQGKQRGIAALCIGGGEATAIALER